MGNMAEEYGLSDDRNGEEFSQAELGLSALDAAGFPVAHAPDQGTELGDLVATARIDPEDLIGEMMRVPAVLAWWNSRSAEAERALLLAKLDLERCRASLYLKVRSSAETRGVKLTEESVNSMILAQPEYREARIAHIEAEAESMRLIAGCKTLAAKKDMLNAINNRTNAELRSDPVARSTHAR